MSSAALAFDRLAYVDRLTSEGIDERQARAHAAALEIALGETVATKADLRELGRELRAEMAELRAEMADLRAEIRQVDGRIGHVEARLEAKVEAATANLKVDILRWLVVTQAALGGFLFAALKFAH